MGYTTEFQGSFDIDRPLDFETAALLTALDAVVPAAAARWVAVAARGRSRRD